MVIIAEHSRDLPGSLRVRDPEAERSVVFPRRMIAGPPDDRPRVALSNLRVERRRLHGRRPAGPLLLHRHQPPAEGPAARADGLRDQPRPDRRGLPARRGRERYFTYTVLM